MPDLKISQLPVASATTGAELFPVVQGGVTKQIALNAVRHIGSAVFDASGNLGIGTASPAYKLDVSATTNAVGIATSVAYGAVGEVYSAYRFHNTSFSGGNSEIRNVVNGATSLGSALRFFTSQNGTGVLTERATLDNSGNLGLGVTPSAWATGCTAFQLDSYSALFESVVGRTSLAFNARESATNSYVYLQNESATMYQQVSGVHSWYTAPSGTAGNAISFTERLRVDATTTAGQTALLLWDVDNGTLERVTVGAADSAGTGFKVLRIPN